MQDNKNNIQTSGSSNSNESSAKYYDNQLPKIMNVGDYPKSRDTGYEDAIPGINTPGIELPAVNPPVPNRAWTALRQNLQNDRLSDKERTNLDNQINNI